MGLGKLRMLPLRRFKVEAVKPTGEWKLFLREGLTVWVALFVLTIFAVAFWSGKNDQSGLQQRYAEATALVAAEKAALRNTLEELEHTGTKERVVPNPASPVTAAARTNPYVLKRQSPLTITAVGEADVQPSLVRLGNPNDPTWVQDEVLSPLALASGRFDLAFAVVALLPLAVIALLFRLYSGERESGLLPLLAAGQTSIWVLMLKRAGLRFLFLSVLVAGLFLVGLLLTGAPIQLGYVASWIVAVIAYLGFWFAACFLVNGLRRPSGSNIVILVSLWLGIVVLAPAGLNLFISKSTLPPSRMAILMEYRSMIEHWEATPKMVEDFYALHGLQGFTTELASAKSMAMRSYAQKAVGDDLAAIESAAKQRDDLTTTFGLANPAIALNSLLVKLAGKDGDSFRDFQGYLKQEDLRRTAYFLPLRLKGAKLRHVDYEDFPTLLPQSEPSLPDPRSSGVLIVWALVMAGGAGFLSLRLKS
jgi:ABC-2 type transport system permease protein